MKNNCHFCSLTHCIVDPLTSTQHSYISDFTIHIWFTINHLLLVLSGAQMNGLIFQRMDLTADKSETGAGFSLLQKVSY